jgi:hypothetical protein
MKWSTKLVLEGSPRNRITVVLDRVDYQQQPTALE